MKIIRLILINLLLLALSSANFAQSIAFTYDNFETQFLNYQPSQRQAVSDKNFSFAKMVIDETKKAVKDDPDGFNIADYWNICTAFYTLNVDHRFLEIAFQKVLDAERSCEYLEELKDDTKLDDLFPEKYQAALTVCKKAPNKKPFNRQEYAKEYNLDDRLLQQMNAINRLDQLFRSKDDYDNNRAAQQELDQQNQARINQLYEKYQQYLGRSLVGEYYESVMWSVIQHSNLQMMEKYLPVIQRAVEEKELALAPLKMLIDRIYTQKYQYQIFGSQQGVSLAPETTINAVREKYKIP
ncbi:MAG: hypothetical protein AB8G15_15105 [Saprospiraceae bacterium]